MVAAAGSDTVALTHTRTKTSLPLALAVVTVIAAWEGTVHMDIYLYAAIFNQAAQSSSEVSFGLHQGRSENSARLLKSSNLAPIGQHMLKIS